MLHHQMSKVALWMPKATQYYIEIQMNVLSIKASAWENTMAAFIPGLCQQVTFRSPLNFRKGQSGAHREVYQQNVSAPHTKPWSHTLTHTCWCVLKRTYQYFLEPVGPHCFLPCGSVFQHLHYESNRVDPTHYVYTPAKSSRSPHTPHRPAESFLLLLQTPKRGRAPHCP